MYYSIHNYKGKYLNYQEFLKYIKINNLSVKHIEQELGYSQKSIFNNWKKNDKVPDKALLAIKMYIKIKEQDSIINKLLTKKIDNVQLSPNVYKIAQEKSSQYDISIEEYIKSLIISNI